MKNIILITVSCFLLQPLVAQDVIQNSFKEDTEVPERMNDVYHKEHHNTRKKVKLETIREADVMWSSKIWREIDLRQKINHPIYYPQEKRKGVHTIDRYNLFDVLYNAAIGNDGMDGNKIRVFGRNNEAEYDDEFNAMPLSVEEIQDKILGAYGETGEIMDNADGEDSIADGRLVRWAPDREDPIVREDIKKWIVKEQWFFDKERSVMDVRIIGLCPVYTKKDGDTYEDIKLFWFYFPECRRVLKNALAFNLVKNEAENKTYEDIFMKRMFGSTIIKQGSVSDRAINEYMIGLDALLEAERIKTEIFNFEHDLWEY